MLIIAIAIVFDVSEKIDDFLAKQPPLRAIVFDYYLNFIPFFVNLFSYLFIFVAVIFFTSKMASRSEVIAILSIGVSYRRFLFPYLLSASVIALVSFMLQGYIIPHSSKTRLDFEFTYFNKGQQYSDRNIHKQIAPGVYIYVANFNDRLKVCNSFLLESIKDGRLTSRLTADQARWDSLRLIWTLDNYILRKYLPDGIERVERGPKLDTMLLLSPKDFYMHRQQVESMTNPVLRKYIKTEREKGTQMEFYQVELNRRYAAPFSAFILTIIGATVSSRRKRGGTGLNLGLGLLLSFAYIVFSQVSSQFAISGGVKPWLAVWIPNMVYTLIAAALYRQAPK